jgi:hypothetical protein
MNSNTNLNGRLIVPTVTAANVGVQVGTASQVDQYVPTHTHTDWAVQATFNAQGVRPAEPASLTIAHVAVAPGFKSHQFYRRPNIHGGHAHLRTHSYPDIRERRGQHD